MSNHLISIKSSAERLAVSPDTIRRLIALGELRAIRVSRRVLILEAEIDRACMQGVGSSRRHPVTVRAKVAPAAHGGTE